MALVRGSWQICHISWLGDIPACYKPSRGRTVEGNQNLKSGIDSESIFLQFLKSFTMSNPFVTYIPMRIRIPSEERQTAQQVIRNDPLVELGDQLGEPEEVLGDEEEEEIKVSIVIFLEFFWNWF